MGSDLVLCVATKVRSVDDGFPVTAVDYPQLLIKNNLALEKIGTIVGPRWGLRNLCLNKLTGVSSAPEIVCF